jgi:H+/Cl- antiporter ClcA/CBS domain-containing protein
MPGGEVERASTTQEGLPISPSMGPALAAADLPTRATPVDPRVIYISLLALIVGIAAGLMARVLIWLIHLLTHLSFHAPSPNDGLIAPLAHPGPWVIAVPVIGAFLIGLLARYGSRAVAGHGIPEAMEQVLTNQSRIPPKLTFLKPFSAAISIGTGAPYGAEGPIIATGGALGSLFGQLLSVTAEERKVLLAAGAAAGIAAAFNAPIASVLLAVELLLFEFRPRSLIPVAIACVAAASMHVAFEGSDPFFKFGRDITMPSHTAVGLYLGIGCIVGIGAVVLTRTVYAIEHFFEHLPIHWMWHPAIGALIVGIIGWRLPQTFGSGYYNIDNLLQNNYAIGFVALLGILKFLSWTISLGSGTAGGTLAPVFTIGGTLGALLGFACRRYFPHAGVEVGVAALVGMVGIFAGASRALLTSVVFAVETTLQPSTILPALGGCVTAYLVSSLLMRHSIMTLKMARQGVRVPEEYHPDFLDRVLVRQVISGEVASLRDSDTLEHAREWINSHAPGSQHHGFPLLDENDHLVGVVTRRDLLNPDHRGDIRLAELIHRQVKVVYDDCTLREAADHMVNHDIGRLPVIDRENPSRVIGMITRSDLLAAHRVRLRDTQEIKRTLKLSELRPKRLRHRELQGEKR